ncbi:hypothetical protein V499_02862 [Pseudogymnoascus sp. VKM F-103]|nr:hypothetical protein V499_02862 [Pseudogymnoascus sp. VKM F-103]
MGTRHLICVFYLGRFVIAQYGQFDGYPEVQGLAVITFLLAPGNIARLKAGLTHTYTPTAEEVEEMTRSIARQGEEYHAALVRGEVSVMSRMKPTCPSMWRETSAGMLEVVAGATAGATVPIYQELGFIHDGLFCEWAYVVDLDAEVLEVYSGVEKEREGSSQRFKDVDGAEKGWVPALVKSFAFGELPGTKDDLVREINEAIELRAREAVAREQGKDGGGDNAAAVSAVL